MLPNCPHCGSKYVVDKGIVDSTEKSSHKYYCQGCNRDFSVDTQKATAQGEWLMTFESHAYRHSDGDIEQFIEVYRAPNGKLVINQKKRDGKHVSGQVRLDFTFSQNPHISSENDRYFVDISSFQNPNDPNGALFSIDRIRMSKEQTELALKNEAMRIVHKKDGMFYLKNYHTAQLNRDICTYLVSALGEGAREKQQSACYVATAVYGSYDCPQVWTLRRFRDESLASNLFGRAFIRAYYAISPTIVKHFGHTAWFNRFWRSKLDKLVARLQKKGFEDTPYLH